MKLLEIINYGIKLSYLMKTYHLSILQYMLSTNYTEFTQINKEKGRHLKFISLLWILIKPISSFLNRPLDDFAPGSLNHYKGSKQTPKSHFPN